MTSGPNRCFFFEYISSQCEGSRKKTHQAKGKTIPPLNLPRRHPPHPFLPRFLPSLPLFAALLTTVTAALITPLWSPRVAGTCHPPSRGSPANYRHPSEGPRRCSSVAVAIITAPLQTSVLWTASPSGPSTVALRAPVSGSTSDLALKPGRG